MVWTHDARPQTAQEFGLETLLSVAFADDGALKIEELTVYVLEEGEEGSGVCKLSVNAFF